MSAPIAFQPPLTIRHFPGLSPYLPIYDAMRQFTAGRNTWQADQFWILQHEPVYTLGLAGKPEHILNSNGIPVQQVDRGGQVTYHGPGQLVIYVLINLKRQKYHVKSLVYALEQSLLDFLKSQGCLAQRRDKSPGVYVGEKKIAALGLRISRGCTYHGISLNVDMDLKPFAGINPCGYPGLAVTRLKDEGVGLSPEEAAHEYIPYLCRSLGY